MSTTFETDADQANAPPIGNKAAKARCWKTLFAVGRGKDRPANLAEIVYEAGWLLADFEKRVPMFRRRLEAVRERDVESPRLEAEAAKLEATAQAKQAEFAQQAAKLQERFPGSLASYKAEEFELAREKRRTAQGTRAEAVNVLRQTADPSLAERAHQLLGRAQGTRRQIEQRSEVVNAPERIAQLRQQVEQLARDREQPEQLGRIRQKLRHLQSLLSHRPAAIKANAADEKTIAKLQEERAKVRALIFEPEGMAFLHG